MRTKLITGAAVLVLALILAAAPGRGGRDVRAALEDTPTPTTVPATNTPVLATATTAATAVPTATPVVIVTSPVINFPQATCAGSGFSNFSSANVTFSWQPALGASVQYLDLSLFDNNFQDGTYLSTGALPPTQNTFTWNGLLVGQAHFWRVSALTPAGWVSSPFADFSPCGNPVLLPMTYVCTGLGRASITFRWAPATPAGLFTFVDLTLFNNNFAPDTFINGGPFPSTNGALVWPGILANMVHYVRVNTFNGAFWTPSQTGNFSASC
jgi:hypothetical protein